MQEFLRKAIQEASGLEGDFLVAPLEDLSRGDYYTNVAMVMAKAEGKNPQTLAQELKGKLESASIENVASIEAAGPGFLNFKLKRGFFSKEIERIVEEAKNFGKGGGYAGKKILVEYTSPNLFKPLHIGNLVGNILGESVARLLERSGADITRLNYPSDIGLTVAKGVWGLKKTGGDPKDISALGEAYRVGNAAYEDTTAKTEIEAVNKALYENSDAGLSSLRQIGIETSRRHLNALCSTLGTTFDKEFFESESAVIGKDIVQKHIGDVFENSEGAVVFKGSHTRVFLNSQGLPTYEAKEVGLFDLKSRSFPEFNISFTVTGVEQREFFAVVFESIRKVFPDRTEGRILQHIANGFLRLTTGKMSSRLGNVITAEDLLTQTAENASERMKEFEGSAEEKAKIAEMVAVAALKYTILRQAAGKDITYDPQQALSLEGDSGPYLQYALVRAKTLLAKAQEAGESADIKNTPEEVTNVERVLHRFPEILARSAKELAPQHVVTYLTEVASAFNAFYAGTRVIGNPHAGYYLALTEAVAVVLENGLSVLGIPTPEKM